MCQMEAHMQVPSSTSDQTLRHHRDDDARQGFRCTKGEPSGSSDAALITPAAAPDTGKKKRVQRAAKLKQCKLDARREQWLAKVTGKISKPESCVSNQDDKQSRHWSSELDIGSEDGTGLLHRGKDVHTEEPRSTWDSKSASYKVGEDNFSEGMSCSSQVAISESRRRGGSSVPEPESQSMPTSNSRFVAHTNQLDGSSTWSSSDSSSMRSNSSQSSSSSGGSGSDDEKEVDDWEVVADALHVQASVDEDKSHGVESQCRDDERGAMMSSSMAQGNSAIVTNSMANDCVLKPESRYSRSGTFAARTRADVGRAWRPDDTSRPPTLPRLSKQHSFPLPTGTSVWGASHGSLWGIPPAPSHCPICTEELDTTDSSFMPCSCGFRLCLFCHHRIASGDGRCPGCRKAYNSQVATKLSRTSSVRPRI